MQIALKQLIRFNSLFLSMLNFIYNLFALLLHFSILVGEKKAEQLGCTAITDHFANEFEHRFTFKNV